MTQITRLFPHLPDPSSRLGGGASSAPQPVRGNEVGPTEASSKRKFLTPEIKAPTGPLSGDPTTVERNSLQRLSRLISVLETNPAIPEHVRTMPGVAVLRNQLEMQCALEGLIRGLIKE
ncbi:MAG: hypothetical protein MUE52_07455 [Tabrizicola sp.]|jgi:hypothetical protein|nr:hypothetical protein [Tabrizicola sp.]